MNKKATCNISFNVPSVVRQRKGEIYGSHCNSDETRISHSNGEMKKTINSMGAQWFAKTK
jgi:hypothetical protein